MRATQRRYVELMYGEVYRWSMQQSVIRAVRKGVSTAARGVPGTALAVLGQLAGGRRRRAVVCMVGGALVVAFLAVSAVAQFPITVADTAAAWIFGGRESHAGASRVPDICVVPPTPRQARPMDAPPGRGPTPDPAQPLAPAGIGPDGRPTNSARAVLARIPAGADVTVTQGWILFGLTHPRDAGMPFSDFVTLFDRASQRLTDQATALDVVASLDPRADYSPYLLLAQVGSYQLMRQGSVVASDTERDALIEAINVTCRGSSR